MELPRLPGSAASALAGLLSILIIGFAPPAVARAETVPLPLGAATGVSLDDPIWQVSCPGAGDCVAVGGYVDVSGNNQALIESEAGGAWSPDNVSDASLVDPGSPPAPNLVGVSCASIGNCVAVDAYNDADGDERGLIDTLLDGTWTPIAAPLTGLSSLGSPYYVEVLDVSCPSVGGCAGVGYYTDTGGDRQALIENESDGSWSAEEAPSPPSSDSRSEEPWFTGLACATVGNCAAVGYYTDSSGNQQGLLETDSGGTWSAVGLDLSGLSPAADPQATLYSVSCPSAGNCAAVGTYQDAAGSYEGLVVSEVDGTWQPATKATLPTDASTQTVGGNPPQSDLYLNAISCASAGNCTAVGSYDATVANNVEALSLTETGGTWAAAAQTSLPAGAADDPEASLDSITCQAAGACLAAGTYVDSAGDNVALVARQTPDGWSTEGAPLGSAYDGNDPGSKASVACATDGYCATGGYVTDDASDSSSAFLLDAPAAPVSPAASLGASPGATQATVSWSAPSDDGGLPLTGYTVTANDLTAPASGGQTTTVDAPATDAVISGLSPGDSYTFTVTASSLLGTGLAATSASVSVPGGSAPSPTPTNPSPTPTIPTPTSTSTIPTTTAAAATTATQHSPSAAQIKASLASLLRPGSRAMRASLHRAGAYALTYDALEAGRISVQWSLVSGQGRATHRSLIASGTTRAHGPGVVTVEVHLTAAGRRLLPSGDIQQLTALASFTGGELEVSRTSRFTLPA